MAAVAKRLAANVPGEFFVDSTCIDCGTCREIAPETFAPAGGHSVVVHQPDRGPLGVLVLLAICVGTYAAGEYVICEQQSECEAGTCTPFSTKSIDMGACIQ